jgi:UDP-N-acetylmuramoyl-L-alanyl-D-glutamate--2,6-diaminopimelate ligase
VVIVTSDNPRSEDPGAILADIVKGIVAEGFLQARGPVSWEEGYFEVIPDRKSAIARALVIARRGDTIAIAGKGHENVQIIGDRRLPFDDRETVKTILAGGG